MKKILFTFFVLFVIAFFVRDDLDDLFTSNVILEEEEKMISNNFGEISVYFCPEDDCEKVLVDEISKSGKVDCAFYDFNLDSVINALNKKNYRLIMDDRNVNKVNLTNIKDDGRSGLMHNKFCVLDGSRIVTGSMNPTKNGVNRNNNNLIVIDSITLAENYQDEFNEMWFGEFGTGDIVQNPKVYFNGFLIENYFCPEDCVSQLSSDYSNDGGLNKLLYLVEQADSSIKIAAFTFTSDRLRDALIKAQHYGINVKIVIEKRNRNTLGSEYEVLRDAGIDIRLDENKGNMHQNC